MYLDRYKWKGMQGIGWIVLLVGLMLPAAVGTVFAVMRMQRPRLKYIPAVLVLGLRLGSAIFWGSVQVVFAVLMVIAFIVTETPDSDAWIVMGVFILPCLLSGVCLLVYASRDRVYRAAAEELLRRIAADEALAADLTLKVAGGAAGPQQVADILADMADQGLIAYETAPDGGRRAWVVDRDLLSMMAGHRDRKVGARAAEAWTCPSCGAPNRTAAGGSCAYCGGSRETESA